MESIPIRLDSDLAQSFKGYTIGELQEVTAELLQMITDETDLEHAVQLDLAHARLSHAACSATKESAGNVAEFFFITLAMGIDMIATAIQAIEKTAFMAEVDNLGMEEE